MKNIFERGVSLVNPKESYYAALEKQTLGENTIRERFERRPATGEPDSDALDTLYTEIGMKAFHVFHGCLDWLGRLGSGTQSRPGSGSNASTQMVQAMINDHLADFKREFADIKDRIDRLDTSLTAIEAGMRRIDKFTLDAFRNIQQVEEQLQQAVTVGLRDDSEHTLRGRLPKEEAAKLAIEAARNMQSEGRRLTLAAIAREAGLKYGQIVYAFGNKEGFFKALEELNEQTMDHSLEAGA